MADATGSPFQIADGGGSVAPMAGEVAGDDIARLVDSAELFLFMKGSPEQPMCGFSANTVAIIDTLGVEYATFDVLSHEGVRAAAKRYANWPTFPQVYLRGEFIGGNDIITEMYASGELARLVRTGGGR